MSAAGERTFGVLVSTDAEPDAMAGRCRWLEALGFDQLYLPDHLGDYRDPSGPWFDGWVTLAAAATATERIRIGMLVANPILRPPAVMAKQAVTIDHLSRGRLDLGPKGCDCTAATPPRTGHTSNRRRHRSREL